MLCVQNELRFHSTVNVVLQSNCVLLFARAWNESYLAVRYMKGRIEITWKRTIMAKTRNQSINIRTCEQSRRQNGNLCSIDVTGRHKSIQWIGCNCAEYFFAFVANSTAFILTFDPHTTRTHSHAAPFHCSYMACLVHISIAAFLYILLSYFSIRFYFMQRIPRSHSWIPSCLFF